MKNPQTSLFSDEDDDFLKTTDKIKVSKILCRAIREIVYRTMTVFSLNSFDFYFQYVKTLSYTQIVIHKADNNKPLINLQTRRYSHLFCYLRHWHEVLIYSCVPGMWLTNVCSGGRFVLLLAPLVHTIGGYAQEL